jgi:hypothetical protein
VNEEARAHWVTVAPAGYRRVVGIFVVEEVFSPLQSPEKFADHTRFHSA